MLGKNSLESKSWSASAKANSMHEDRCRARSIPLDSPGILRGTLDAAWQRSKYRNPGELVFASHVVPPHLGPDAYTAWGGSHVNNARLILEGTSRPKSFYDFGGAIKSITCLSFRR